MTDTDKLQAGETPSTLVNPADSPQKDDALMEDGADEESFPDVNETNADPQSPDEVSPGDAGDIDEPGKGGDIDYPDSTGDEDIPGRGGDVDHPGKTPPEVPPGITNLPPD